MVIIIVLASFYIQAETVSVFWGVVGGWGGGVGSIIYCLYIPHLKVE